MTKTKTLKITIKKYKSKKVFLIALQKEKPKKFLENWYKQLHAFVEQKTD